MAIKIPKREDVIKNVKTTSNIVIPSRNQQKTKQEINKGSGQNIRTVGFPEHLGGGTYKISDNPDELIRTTRSQSALPPIGTAERDHIISVALGGTSDRENLQYLATTGEGRQEGKVSVEQKAINDYTSGKITLNQARLKVQTKQQQIKGLTPTEKEQTWQGQIGNVLKDAVKNVFSTVINTEKNIIKGAYDKAENVLTKTGVFGQEKRKELIAKEKTPEFKLEKAQKEEKKAETMAKVLTAPIRYTAGSLASAVTSYALEKADSEGKYTPKTDAEKLLINDVDIQRLTKQEDLYGTIARGASVPVALITMAVIESPFIAGTGAKQLVKETLEKEIKKLSAEQFSKIGIKEIIRISNGVIRAEQKAGKLSKQEAEQAVKELSNIRVVEPKVEPKIKIPERVEPLVQEAKKYKSAEEFVNGRLGGEIEYQAKNDEMIGNVFDIRKDGNKLSVSLKETPNELMVGNINADIRGTGIGKDFVNELKNYSDATGKTIVISDVTTGGHNFWKGFSWFEENVDKYGLGYKYKPKSQLTDIWNKAHKAPELKYEPTIAQPSVPNRIKNEAIEKGIKADFKGIEEYEKVSFKDQAKLVGDIIDEDPEKAIRIALGKELPTNGALPESVFIAVKNQAMKNRDTELLVRLATEEGGVAKESTVLGQRIKMLDEQLEDDAFRNINQVVKARKAKLKKRGISVQKAKKAEVNKIKSEIVKAKPKKDEWLAFIDEIEC